MGRRIITNFKDEYKLYSTVSDGIIYESDNKKDLLNFIATERIYNAKLKAIEVLMYGLDGMSVNDSMFYSEENRIENINKYQVWLRKIHKAVTYEEYYKLIDEKLEYLIKG